MNYSIGLDISKSLISVFIPINNRSIEIENSLKGLKKLVSKLKKLYKKEFGQLVFVYEPTGSYSNLLKKFCADRVISGGKGKVIHIWDLKKIKPLMNPILNLFVGRYNNEWIIWTPKGYYNASKNGEIYLGYHLNHGEGHEAEFLEISKFRKELYRPKLIEKIVERE